MENSEYKKGKFISGLIKKIKYKCRSRGFVNASISSALAIIVLACVVIFNIIFSLLGNKFNLSLDLTRNKAFTLTQQSVDFIKNVNKDIEIIILNDETTFSSMDRYFKQANSVLKQYSGLSSKIKLSYIDVVKNPSYLQNKDFASEKLATNSIIVRSNDKYKVISVNDLFDISYGYYGGGGIVASKAEQELTSAILYVTSESQKEIAFLTGYDEADYSSLIELLKKNNYSVKEIPLLTGDITDDVSCAIIFAPSRDYDNTGMEKVQKYMNNKGSNLLYIANPDLTVFPKLEKFLQDWKIKVKDGLVYETDAAKITSNGNIFSAVSEYVDSDYTKKLKDKKTPVLLPFSKPIEILDEKTVKVLLNYSETSGVMPIGKGGKDFDIKANICGPNPVAVISEKDTDNVKSTVTLFGSFAGLTQGYLEATSINNSAYFTELLDTITKKENANITIEPKSIENEELGINAATAGAIGFSVMGILPLLIVLVGILVFFKRRHL